MKPIWHDMGPDTGLRYERDMDRDMVCQHISIAFSISRPYRKRAERDIGSVPISQSISQGHIEAHIVWYRGPYRAGIATISVSYRKTGRRELHIVPISRGRGSISRRYRVVYRKIAGVAVLKNGRGFQKWVVTFISQRYRGGIASNTPRYRIHIASEGVGYRGRRNHIAAHIVADIAPISVDIAFISETIPGAGIARHIGEHSASVSRDCVFISRAAPETWPANRKRWPGRALVLCVPCPR